MSDFSRMNAALPLAATRTIDAIASEVDIVFRRQPRPVPARHRVTYRTALIVLVLSRFNQGAAKVTHLHTMMWAMRTARTRNMFLAWWEGRRFYTTITSRLDPDLQVTLNLALVDGLVVAVSNGMRIRLTEKGQALASLIADEEVLSGEKAFLDRLPRLSDAAMVRHLGEVTP